MVHFQGTDYRSHTSCMSEAQKYQGHLYRGEKKGKGGQQQKKQDQALVNAQLQKEAAIRERVNDVKAKLQQGLHLVRSLVLARVEQLRTFVSPLATLLREGAFGNAVTLVGDASFETYLVSKPGVNSEARC